MELGEVCTLLDGCTRHLQRGAPPRSNASEDLMQRLIAVAYTEVYQGHSAAVLEQAGLLRALADLGAALAEWGAQPSSAWSQATPGSLLRDAYVATHAIGCGSILLVSVHAQLSDGDLLRWVRGAGALECVARRAMHAVLTAQAAGGDAFDRVLPQAVELVQRQLRVWIPLFSLLEPRSRALQVFAATVMPPPKMLAMLSVSASMMVLARTAGCPLGNTAQLFMGPCHNLFASKAFGQHQAAAVANPALLQQLAELLHLALQSAKDAVLHAMAEEAGGSPAHLVAEVSYFMAALETVHTPAFGPALRLNLSGATACDTLQAVVEAVELSARLPPGAAHRSTARAFAVLAFCTLCQELEKEGQGQAAVQEPTAAQVQAEQAALRLLPSLATTAEQLSSVETHKNLAAAVVLYSQAVARMACRAAQRSLDGVSSASSAMQHLQLVSGAVPALLQLAGAAMAAPAINGDTTFAVAASPLLWVLGWLARSLPSALLQGGQPNQDVTQELRTSLYDDSCRVHASLCCWSHRLGGSSQGVPAVVWDALVISLDACLNACADAAALLGLLDEATQRVLLRTSAAHCCAIVEARRQGVAISTHDDTLESLQAAASMALAAQLGSPWLDDPEAWELVACAIPLIPGVLKASSTSQGLGKEAVALAKGVLSAAVDAPRFAARLAGLDGALRTLAEHACGEHPPAAAASASRPTQPSLSPLSEPQNQLGRCQTIVDLLGRTVIAAAVQQQAGAQAAAAPFPAQVVSAAHEAVTLQPLQLPTCEAEAQAALVATIEERLAPLARQLAQTLQEHWQQPEQRQAAALALAQAAATRACANLRCPKVAAFNDEPTARQPIASRRCSGCRVGRYCGTECSHADWRAGHRRVCKALAAAQAAEQEGDA